MKAADIALKDLIRSLRSLGMLVFMFGIPLLVSGMFYVMFGSAGQEGGFNLSRVKVVVANLDEGGPRLQLRGRNVPGNLQANTLGELVVKVLQSDDLSDLMDARVVSDEDTARHAVDTQSAQVAVIIPANFSHQFAEVDEQAVVQIYKDPTLRISPQVVKSIMNQFMDGLSGIKITVDLAQTEAENGNPHLAGIVIQRYIQDYLSRDDNLSESMLDIYDPRHREQQVDNPMISVVGAILVGFMIFFAFYTGTAGAESILREEEERTLPRLFTTPTSYITILSGKFLAVFLTVLVQIFTLITAAPILFGIRWGNPVSLAMMAAGVVVTASATGIFINSFLKDSRQGGIIFGGVLTLTGMIGMMPVFSGGTNTGQIAPLLVPQGWAVHGFFLTMHGGMPGEVLPTALGLFMWGAILFAVGFLRFRRRYQ